MPDRHSDKERWEIYLIQIILVTRPFIFTVGLFLVLFAGLTMYQFPIGSGVSFCLSLITLGLVFSDKLCQYAAQLGAWLATSKRDPNH
jgi:hypothetical protein